jgi:hypothetical protein
MVIVVPEKSCFAGAVAVGAPGVPAVGAEGGLVVGAIEDEGEHPAINTNSRQAANASEDTVFTVILFMLITPL